MDESTTFKRVITKRDDEKHVFGINLDVGIKRRLSYLYDLYEKR
jgi:hypothetical protein